MAAINDKDQSSIASVTKKTIVRTFANMGSTPAPSKYSELAGGRSSPGIIPISLAALGVVGCPIWIAFNWIALEYHDGSLTSALATIASGIYNCQGNALLESLPKPSWTATSMYIGWLLFQSMLYYLLPGKAGFGSRTPGGNMLEYIINGDMAWKLTTGCFLVAVAQGYLDGAVIAHHWQGLLVVANIYGYALALFLYAKAYYMPTRAEDRKFRGSRICDFWMGIELNPRLGERFDLKFFHNGRPGIAAWALINYSFSHYQLEKFGRVSTSMLIVNILQMFYIVDFFENEDWYLRTIDIAHDHFGMMLAWGDTVFLPAFYTLQAQYLARYPIEFTSLQAALILLLGLTGLFIFRSANSQKDKVRRHNGDTTIWGAPATFLKCKYRTSDGKEHQSILLTSGWWGICRHANYTADLLLSFSMCAACAGRAQLLPWSYFIFMSILLTHRTWRDESRCAAKYGDSWDEYCRIVKWRLVPGVY